MTTPAELQHNNKRWVQLLAAAQGWPDATPRRNCPGRLPGPNHHQFKPPADRRDAVSAPFTDNFNPSANGLSGPYRGVCNV